jgi:outer membrane scaffolding protein for murein synthesis (MipA/OmpV family)
LSLRVNLRFSAVVTESRLSMAMRKSPLVARRKSPLVAK